ncbi:MAG TPA: CehA/McbA family metallohydrolase [Thermomicrobiales bacterium]|nr:CehA/McbA family metallohydrolase [Thermomicrobiales bacterium]
MRSLPFRLPGRFYRGNLHTHSSNSDGALPPEEVARAYQRNGYDFLAITDHFSERYDFPITDSTPFRTATFTTLLGAELHAPEMENGETWHLLGVGLPADFPPRSANEDGPALAARARAAGAFVGVTHPAWYSNTLNDIRSIEAAHAIEVYNQTCVMHNDRGDAWYAADLLLAEGRRYLTYGADDAHFRPERPDAHGAWVMVRAEALDPDALLASLKAGHFYTSQGPRIHDIDISEDKSTMTVACSPAASVYIAGAASRSAANHGHGITSTTFPLDKYLGGHCRVTVVDAGGKKAWSNPVWMD